MKSTSAILLSMSLIFIAVLDIIIIYTYGADYSISGIVQKQAFNSLLFTFMCGYVNGHIFGYLAKSNKTGNRMTQTGFYAMIAIIFIGICDLLLNATGFKYLSMPISNIAIIFIIGFICGPIISRFEPSK